MFENITWRRDSKSVSFIHPLLHCPFLRYESKRCAILRLADSCLWTSLPLLCESNQFNNLSSINSAEKHTLAARRRSSLIANCNFKEWRRRPCKLCVDDKESPKLTTAKLNVRNSRPTDDSESDNVWWADWRFLCYFRRGDSDGRRKSMKRGDHWPNQTIPSDELLISMKLHRKHG